MLNDNAAKWVEALRSDEFAQAIGSLAKTQPDGTVGYCCLGVLCEVYRRETGEGEWKPEESRSTLLFQLDNEITVAWLPKKVQDWAGLSENLGAWDEDNMLTVENDQYRKPFSKIAAIIESKPGYLFNE